MIFAHNDNEPVIELDVEGAGNPLFPGDMLHATVTLTTKKGVEAKRLHAGLQRHSRHQVATKKGDDTGHKWSTQEEWVAEEELVGEADLARGLNNTYQLRWRIPDDTTPSYNGEIIQHAYKLIVSLDRAEGKAIKKEVELQVIEPAPGQRLEPGSYGECTNAADADMHFKLPKLEFVEGEALVGQLLLEPHVSIEAKEVRLELWREEMVKEGDAENTKAHHAETHKVAGISIFSKGEPATYDFSFPVNVKGCPTFKRKEAQGSWLLKAVISRPLAVDCEVEQRVYLYGAYRQG